MGLLVAGAGLDLDALKHAGSRTIAWSLVRLLADANSRCHHRSKSALDVTGVALAVIAIAAATPTATNGYVLARQLGGDPPFMANLIATQTVLAVVTMPFIMWVFDLV